MNRWQARRVRGFFGLGFGVERYTECDQGGMRSWPAIHYKVYFGPWILAGDIGLTRWTKKVVP